MIYSLILTVLLVLLFLKARSSLGFELTYTSISEALRNSILNWKKISSIYLLIFYFLFMLFPLFWGLTFYLQSDANVAVVILSFTWIYNWTKYIFLNEKLER